jgi:hypothetical protein
MYPSKFQEQRPTSGGLLGKMLDATSTSYFSKSNPVIVAMCNNILKLMGDSLQETLQVYLLKTKRGQDLNVSITSQDLDYNLGVHPK